MPGIRPEGNFKKAIVCTQYGPPELLEFREVEKPVPTGTEVLVEVHASSVNCNNLIHVTGEPWVARYLSVTQFRPGDATFGDSDIVWNTASIEIPALLGDLRRIAHAQT